MKTAIAQASTKGAKAPALAVFLTAALISAGVGALTQAQDETRTVATGSGIRLAQDAPDRYTVKHGDTLWDIAKVFLRDPWYWPEIWYVNPQVKNPHLIYPGDVLVLVKGGALPQVTIAERGPEGTAAESAPSSEPAATTAPAGRTQSGPVTKLSPQIRTSPITSAVTTIPYDTIASFLGRPTLMSKSEAKSGPYVVDLRDQHIVGGAGTDIYARGVKNASENTRFNIMHIDDELRDPETNKVLGYRGIYAGTGAVV
ncbi:MAG TPA: LysM peptidoglycan-binding domain-containing protein, partial [Steroidobacteraceae bacterium]|nr:LysM peptidoglycan-binding domain-containing protein [Steroidobacteraceae bacterium]